MFWVSNWWKWDEFQFYLIELVEIAGFSARALMSAARERSDGARCGEESLAWESSSFFNSSFSVIFV